jgi:tryptophanyl-tRNA synthetase
MINQKRRILSGIQATASNPHLGNLAGAIKPWVDLQSEYEVFCFIADLHSLTTLYHDPSAISKNARETVRDLLAAGIDPDKSAIFLQSHVKEHYELHLLFSMITPLGWLERVPTYKEKKQTVGAEREPYGLLGYPVLQAADILLYKPHGVPVGLDQAPHLELSREIGRRFNHLYGEVFPEFKNLISDVPTLLGTDGRKMSKSYGNGIFMADTEDETVAKIKTSYTDPLKLKKDDPGHPEGCSIFSLHSAFNQPNIAIVEKECKEGARGCVQCKQECISAVNTALKPIRENRLKLQPFDIEDAITKGAIKAREVASATMSEVRSAMNLY